MRWIMSCESMGASAVAALILTVAAAAASAQVLDFGATREFRLAAGATYPSGQPIQRLPVVAPTAAGCPAMAATATFAAPGEGNGAPPRSAATLRGVESAAYQEPLNTLRRAADNSETAPAAGSPIPTPPAPVMGSNRTPLAPLNGANAMAQAPFAAGVAPAPSPSLLPGSDATGSALGPAGVGNAASPAAGTQTFGPPPEDTRLLFLRSVTPLLQPGHHEFDWGISYSMQESRIPVLTAGNVFDNRRFRDRRIYVPFALRAGITDRAQGFLNFPVGWGHTETADAGFQDQDTDFDVGDIAGGVNYLLRRGRGVCPDVVGTLDFSIPTGALPYQADPFSAVTSDGFYSLGGNVLWIREFDPIVLYYGIGYRHRFERDYLGGVVTPGEEVTYNLGVGFGVNERITLSTTLLGAFQTDYQFNGATIPHSSQEPISLRCAVTTIWDSCRIVEPYVFIGLTDDAPDAQLGVIVTRSF